MQWNRVRRGARRPGNFRLCRPSTGSDAGPAGPTSGHQPVQRSAPRRASGSARSAPRAWAAASTTSRSRRAIRTSSTSATPSAASSSPRTTACRSSRFSRPTASRRSATSPSIRAIPNIVYIGTGEANNRQTTSFGDGIYKTTDGGKTFTNIGLKETQTIARIVIDPKNPETVYVASPGHLFGPNPDRGVFKTTDGGKTWNKIKFIDDDTGFSDIVARPGQQQHHLRGELSAPPQRLLLQRRRRRQRDLEEHRRRQDLEPADRQRAAARHLRPHRARRLALAIRTSSTRRSKPARPGRRSARNLVRADRGD